LNKLSVLLGARSP